MFFYRYRISRIKIILLQALIITAVHLGSISYASTSTETDSETIQIISQVILDLRKANPNIEITREMVVNELQKRRDNEKLLLSKKQQKHKALKAKNRAMEKKIIEKAIKDEDIGYLQRLVADKYKISSIEARHMIMNHDERVYVVLRAIIRNSGS